MGKNLPQITTHLRCLGIFDLYGGTVDKKTCVILAESSKVGQLFTYLLQWCLSQITIGNFLKMASTILFNKIACGFEVMTSNYRELVVKNHLRIFFLVKNREKS